MDCDVVLCALKKKPSQMHTHSLAQKSFFCIKDILQKKLHPLVVGFVTQTRILKLCVRSATVF